MKYQKQLKIKAYRESNEGKVSNLLKKLRESISIEDKMIKLKEKIYKQKQALTTMKDEQKRAEIEIYLKQLEQAFDNYSLEMNQKSYQTNDNYKYLEQISIIVQKIKVIHYIYKPLEPLRDNEKQIHKNLKNLNRFEEHLLMIKCGISTQSFIAEIQRIITVVSQKRHQQIQLINSDQICKIEQQEPEEDLSIKMPINNLIDKIEQLNLDQETPTAGENLDQILEKDIDKDIEPAIEKKVEKQEDHDVPEGEKCSICLAKRKQYIAIPCGHFIYCKDCHMIVKSQMLCLLCRQTVWQLTKVFE